MSHKYSIEQLFHFNCESCSKWWSIGDYTPDDNATLLCPHCGAGAYAYEIGGE